MKQLLFIFCLIAAFVACNDDDDNNKDNPKEELPIKNLVMPSATTTFTTGQTVTIQGKGFTANSEIWLRNITKAEDDIPTTITNVDDSSISFTVPEKVSGEKQVILKQDGKQYPLGKLNFESVEIHQAKFYAFCYDDDKNELAELDIENQKIRWTGIKIPEYEGNGRGETFDEKNNFIAFEPYPARIHKINMITKEKETIILEKEKENHNFNKIIKSSDNKFYAFCYDEDKNELAELDMENEKIRWTGIKIPEYKGNGRGETFDEKNNFIAFEPYPARIHRINMDTKKIETIILEKEKENRNFYKIIKSGDNKFYAFCYDDDKNELAELDIENEKIRWTGIKISGYKGEGRGETFDENNNFVAFELYNPAATIYKVDITTKKVKIIPLKNSEEAHNFNDILKN